MRLPVRARNKNGCRQQRHCATTTRPSQKWSAAVPGRIEIDDVAPVVSCGNYPAKAVVGEVVPVCARCGARATTRWRPLWSCATTGRPTRRSADRSAPQGLAEPRGGADETAVAPPRVKPQQSPMAPGSHPGCVPRPVRARPGGPVDVSGWTAGAIRSPRGGMRSPRNWTRARAKPNSPTTSGRRPTAGAGRHRRARARSPRSAARGRGRPCARPVTRSTRAAPALSHEVTELLARVSAARTGHPRRSIRRLGGPPAGPVRLLVRDLPPLDRRLGRRRPSGARHVRHRRGKALPRIAAMGFDVVYLPPIHPIGKVHRKGRNNSVTAEPGDVGSPWAIGSDEGGHDAVHPELGTIDDFDEFVAAAARTGHGGGAGPGAAVRAGPPVGQGAPRVVHRAARRHHRLRGEPAEEVPGHLSAELRQRPGRPVRRGAARGPALDRPRRQDLPGRQPAHQAAGLLGVADRQGQGDRPRRAVPVRGVHPPGPAVRSGQARIHAVLHATSPGARPSGSSPSSANRSPSTPTTPGRTCSSTPRTSCTRACSTAAPACSRSARCWPRR